MYRPVLVTAPSTFPLVLADAVAHLRLEDAPFDAGLVQGLIDAAIAYVDGWTGILARCLEAQTWRQHYDCFAPHRHWHHRDHQWDRHHWRGHILRLPLFPVISVTPADGSDPTGVHYLDPDGVSQSVDAANYQLLVDDLGAYVRFDDDFAFPAVQSQGPAVNVTYSAGYAQAGTPAVTTVPAPIRQAMLLMIGHWYANRETVITGLRAAAVQVPQTADALLAPYRRVKF